MSGMRTTLLLAALTGLLLVVGQALGGQQGLIIALIFAGVMIFIGLRAKAGQSSGDA